MSLLVHCSLSGRALFLLSCNNNHKIIAFFSVFLFLHTPNREALPRLDNYRLSLRTFKRPSISLLHGEVLEHIPVSLLNGICCFQIVYWLWMQKEMKRAGDWHLGPEHHNKERLQNSFSTTYFYHY